MKIGNKIPLMLQLFNNESAKFVRAFVRNDANVAISGSPFTLTHLSLGLYSNLSALFPATTFVTVQYVIYDDAGFTTLSEGYEITQETFTIDPDVNSDRSLNAIEGNLDSGELGGFMENCCNSGNSFQDKVVKGSDRTITVRIVMATTKELFDLSTTSDIEARFLNEDDSILSVKMSDSGTPIIIVSAEGGRITVALTADQTADLMANDPAPFSIVLTTTDGTLILNLPTQLVVEDQLNAV